MRFSNFVSSVLTAAVVTTNDLDKPAVCKLDTASCPEGFERRKVDSNDLCLNCDSFEPDGNGQFVCAKSTQKITLLPLHRVTLCSEPVLSVLNRGVPAVCRSRCPRTASILETERGLFCNNCDELQIEGEDMTCKKDGETRQFRVDATQGCLETHNHLIPEEPSPLSQPTIYLDRTCQVGYNSLLPFKEIPGLRVCHNCEKYQSDEGMISCQYKQATFTIPDSRIPILQVSDFNRTISDSFPVCRTTQRCPLHTFFMEHGETSVCYNCTDADLTNTTFSCNAGGSERFTSSVEKIEPCYSPRELPLIQEKEAAVCIGDYACPSGLQPDKEGKAPICHNCDSVVQEGELGTTTGWFNCTRSGRVSTFQKVPDCFTRIPPFQPLRAASPAHVCSVPTEGLHNFCPLVASSLYHEAWQDVVACHNCDEVIRTDTGVQCVKDGKQKAFDSVDFCKNLSTTTQPTTSPTLPGATLTPTLSPTVSDGTKAPTVSPTASNDTLTPTSSPTPLPTENIEQVSPPTPSDGTRNVQAPLLFLALVALFISK